MSGQGAVDALSTDAAMMAFVWFTPLTTAGKFNVLTLFWSLVDKKRGGKHVHAADVFSQVDKIPFLVLQDGSTMMVIVAAAAEGTVLLDVVLATELVLT